MVGHPRKDLPQTIFRDAETQSQQDLFPLGLPPRRMAVNLSARQLNDKGFLDSLVQILDETGLKGSWNFTLREDMRRNIGCRWREGGGFGRLAASRQNFRVKFRTHYIGECGTRAPTLLGHALFTSR